MSFALENLAAGYGRVQVLDDVSLDVEPDEIVALIGPNGAGKSTLLRAATGMIPVRAGRVMLDGRNLVGASIETIARAGISHVPEGRRLFPGLSVADNLRLGGWRIRNTDLAPVVGLFPQLGERLEQVAGSLSGGEQQMCAIGRALMGRPAYLLIDELSLGLAPVVVRRIYEVLPGILESGTTALIVEQDVSQAMRVADRVHCLLEGRSVLQGRPQDLSAEQVEHAYFGIGDALPAGTPGEGSHEPWIG
jgi:branched-chain amino acid transport system ATP-binding protein